MYHIAIDARIINSSTGTYVERLIHYLEKIDKVNTYSILVPRKDKDFYKPKNPNFTVRVADYADYSFSEQLGFLNFLNQLKPDLVHFCMPQQPILYRGRKVTTVHDLTLLNTYNSDKNWLIFHAKQLVGKFVFKTISRTNNLIFVPTRNTEMELIDFAPAAAGKTVLTYEAADKLTKSKLEEYDHPFKSYILYVGQQSDYKNVVRLAEAHQRLLKRHPDLGLILVGKLNASAQKNKSLFESRGYRNIHFTDFIPNSQRDWLYTNASAYLFPSIMEGFGLPGLEAMQYDLPVISSNASCLPEVYGEAAHYFNPYDVNSMSTAINDVLTDDKLRSKLISKAKKQRAKYSWEKMARETHQGYMAALEGSE